MTLTYDGNLGIGGTQPVANLHVFGTSNFENTAAFFDDVSITGSLTVPVFTVPSFNATDIVAAGIITASKYNGIVESLDSNNVIDGIDSKFVHISEKLAVGSASTSTIDNPGRLIIGDTNSTVFVTNGGSIGIGTTTPRIDGDDPDSDERFTIIALNQTAGLGGVGVGTTALQSLVDFSSVGVGRTEVNTIEQTDVAKMRFMLPPKISTTERSQLNTISGAIIYNVTTNKLQVYTGTAWEDLH